MGEKTNPKLLTYLVFTYYWEDGLLTLGALSMPIVLVVRRVPPTWSREIICIFPTFCIYLALSEVYLNVFGNIGRNCTYQRKRLVSYKRL